MIGTRPPRSAPADAAPPKPSASPASAEPLVRFRGVQKTYDGVHLVVRQLDLDIQRGEFLTLLGPSGSGKTTTLMMLAGFESPTAGDIVAFSPPLIIDESEIDEMLAGFGKALDDTLVMVKQKALA